MNKTKLMLIVFFLSGIACNSFAMEQKRSAETKTLAEHKSKKIFRFGSFSPIELASLAYNSAYKPRKFSRARVGSFSPIELVHLARTHQPHDLTPLELATKVRENKPMRIITPLIKKLTPDHMRACLEQAVDSNNPRAAYILSKYASNDQKDAVRQGFSYAATMKNKRVGQALEENINFGNTELSFPEFQLLDWIKQRRVKQQAAYGRAVDKFVEGLIAKTKDRPNGFGETSHPCMHVKQEARDFLIMPREKNDVVNAKAQAYRPMVKAIQTHDNETVKKLLDQDCALDAATAKGESYLTLAAQAGNRSALMTLIAKGAPLTATIRKQLKEIATTKRQQAYEAENKAEVEQYDQLINSLNAFPMANTTHEYSRLLQLLGNILSISGYFNLLRDTNIKNTNGTSFVLALKNRNRNSLNALNALQALFKRDMSRTKLSHNNNTCSFFGNSLFANNPHRALLALQAGVDPNYCKLTEYKPLTNAIASGNNDVVKVLLQYGANPNTQDNGQTPLLHAIIKENAAIVEFLLKAGADPNRKDTLPRSPLHYAVSMNNEKIIELLLKYGADPNITDYGVSPLGDAKFFGKKEDIIRLLEKHGARMNWLDSVLVVNGNTIRIIGFSIAGGITLAKYLGYIS